MNEVPRKFAPGRTRVLVVGGKGEPGEGLESAPAWELATLLSKEYDVLLAVPERTSASHKQFAVVFYNRRNLGLLASDSDLVLVEPGVAGDYSFFTDIGTLFAADWDTISGGSLSGEAIRNLPAPDQAEEARGWLGWAPPVEKRGLLHYLRRLRVHLLTGGVRYTAARGWHVIRWKLSRK